MLWVPDWVYTNVMSARVSIHYCYECESEYTLLLWVQEWVYTIVMSVGCIVDHDMINYHVGSEN